MDPEYFYENGESFDDETPITEEAKERFNYLFDLALESSIEIDYGIGVHSVSSHYSQLNINVREISILTAGVKIVIVYYQKRGKKEGRKE